MTSAELTPIERTKGVIEFRVQQSVALLQQMGVAPEAFQGRSPRRLLSTSCTSGRRSPRNDGPSGMSVGNAVFFTVSFPERLNTQK